MQHPIRRRLHRLPLSLCWLSWNPLMHATPFHPPLVFALLPPAAWRGARLVQTRVHMSSSAPIAPSSVSRARAALHFSHLLTMISIQFYDGHISSSKHRNGGDKRKGERSACIRGEPSGRTPGTPGTPGTVPAGAACVGLKASADMVDDRRIATLSVEPGVRREAAGVARAHTATV
jgi:hypothetical protein